jgi:hypothetical protein
MRNTECGTVDLILVNFGVIFTPHAEVQVQNIGNTLGSDPRLSE